MLSLRTTDEWNCTVTIGVPDLAGDVDTYTNTATSAVEFADAFVAWANDALRAWSGAVTFAWVPEQNLNRGFGIRINVTGDTAEVSPDAACMGVVHWIADTGTTWASEEACEGTWQPSGLGIRQYERWLDGLGDGSGLGVVRNGVAGLALRKPQLSSVATRIECARLLAVLAKAVVPRVGWVYQELDDAWRRLTIGAVRMREADSLLNTIDIEVTG